MPKAKKKLNELKQVDGRLIESDRKQITTSANTKPQNVSITTLEQLWGDSGLVKYGTLDIDQYTKQLNEMNAADIRNHASKHGLMPIENVERLKTRLITEFRKFVGSYNKPDTAGAVINGKKVSKEVLDILSEAK